MKKTLFKVSKLLLVMAALLYGHFIYGQQNSLPSIEASVSELVTIPNSPEASAFIEYGNNTVSMYTGMPDISIPLHTVQGRKLTLPVSLSYSPGIKVDQIATNVGLGWNLNAGGAITRNVLGLPDNYFTGSYATYYSPEFSKSTRIKDQFDLYLNSNISVAVRKPPLIIEEYLDFRRKVLDRKIETQPDSFSFHINGLSGTLYIDYETETGFSLEHPDLKVEVMFGSTSNSGVKELIGWVLTDKLGTRYRFEETEQTQSFEDDSVNLQNIEYHSAWKISEICTFDDSDCIKFSYGSELTYTHPQPVLGATLRRDGPDDDAGTSDCPEGFTQFSGSLEYRIKKSFLQSISVNNKRVVEIEYKPTERLDLRGTYAIDRLNIYNVEDEKINRIDFVSDYFQTSSPDYEFDYRLKLKGIEVYKRSTNNNPERFIFTYYGPDLPARGSFAQDYWGFYNGHGGNRSLIPYNADYNNSFGLGADRNPSDAHIRAGTLRAIHYPTGGSTEYTYEMPYLEKTTSEMVEVTVGNWSLEGGYDESNPIGYCDDESTNGPPKGITDVFYLPKNKGDQYKIHLGAGSSSQIPIQFAAIYLDDPNKTTHCDVMNICHDPEMLFCRNTNLEDEAENVEMNGVYRYMLLNDQPESIGLRVSYEELQQVTRRTYIGSLRVSKIEDKDYDQSIRKQKYYYYGDLSELEPDDITAENLGSNGASSVLLQRPAIYSMLFDSQQFDSRGYYYECEFLNRFSSNQATPTPYIVTYSVVSEVEYDPVNDQYNGFTVNYFHNEDESNGTAPYQKQQMTLLNGKPETVKTYRYDPESDSNLIVQKQEFKYKADFLNKSWRGFNFIGNNDQDFIDLEVRKDGSNHYYDFFARPILGFGGAMEPSPCGMENSDRVACLEPGGTLNDPCTCPSEKFMQRNMGGSSYWVKDVYALTLKYDPVNINSTLPITLTKDYASTDHYQVTSQTTKDDKGKTISLNYHYPHDTTGQTDAMENLIEQHRIGELIKTQQFYDDNTAAQMEKTTSYGIFDEHYLPSEIKLSYDRGKPRLITINNYDQYRLAQEVLDKDGILHTYIRGYDGKQLVAHIVGASYGEVANVFGGTISLLGDDRNAFSFSQHNQLMNSLDNALVTSYTHDDGIGMTAVRDLNGKETIYEYDQFNRLDVITEFDNQLLAYDYNKRNVSGEMSIIGNLNFDGQAINDSKRKSLTLVNEGSSPIVIDDIVLPNNFFKVDISSGVIPANDSLTIKVTFLPTASGNHGGYIVIKANNTAGENRKYISANITD